MEGLLNIAKLLKVRWHHKSSHEGLPPLKVIWKVLCLQKTFKRYLSDLRLHRRLWDGIQSTERMWDDFPSTKAIGGVSVYERLLVLRSYKDYGRSYVLSGYLINNLSIKEMDFRRGMIFQLVF